MKLHVLIPLILVGALVAICAPVSSSDVGYVLIRYTPVPEHQYSCPMVFDLHTITYPGIIPNIHLYPDGTQWLILRPGSYVIQPAQLHMPPIPFNVGTGRFDIISIGVCVP